MKLLWRSEGLFAPEDQLVVGDANGRGYTGYFVRRVDAGFVALWFDSRLAAPFATQKEARDFCEVCYRMGVHK